MSQFFYPDGHVFDLDDEVDCLLRLIFSRMYVFRVLFTTYFDIIRVPWQKMQLAYTAPIPLAWVKKTCTLPSVCERRAMPNE